jgi:hypothetical protein
LRLDRRESALSKADSGNQPIAPREPSQSELVTRISSNDPAPRMPLKGKPLEHAQIEILKKWIAQGAAWPDDGQPPPDARREMLVTEQDRMHWSYLPLRRVEPPEPRDAGWCRATFDLFIQAALERQGLHANPGAERGVLMRRLWLDLPGIPPAPEETQAFMADVRPDA